MGLFQSTVSAPGVEGDSGRGMPALLNEVVRRGFKMLFAKNATYDSTGYAWTKARYEPFIGAATVSVSTDGAGAASVTFPVAFKVTCISVAFATDSGTVCRISGTPSVTGFSIIGQLSATFNIYYVAVGI